MDNSYGGEFDPPVLSEFSRERISAMSQFASVVSRGTSSGERVTPVGASRNSKSGSGWKQEMVVDASVTQELPDLKAYASTQNPVNQYVNRDGVNLISNIKLHPHEAVTGVEMKLSRDSRCKPERETLSRSGKGPIVNIRGELYTRYEQIGAGGSSKVHRVEDAAGNSFALKRVKINDGDPEILAGFKGEIDLLRRLSGESRVVQLVQYAIHDSRIYMVMEKGQLDLECILQNQSRQPLDLSFVRFYATEVLQCVKAVHAHNIVHSDLKPANFLSVNGRLKLIDFGISNIVPEYTVNIHRNSQIGTVSYMAPETLTDNRKLGDGSGPRYKIGRPSDIWSCGCIIYEMVYGAPPFRKFRSKQLSVLKDPRATIEYPATASGGGVVPYSLVEAIQGCLARNPAERLTLEQALESFFFKPRSVDYLFLESLIGKSIGVGQSEDTLSEDEASRISKSLAKRVWHQLVKLNDGASPVSSHMQ